MSSVKSIHQECNRMFKICHDLERIDVHYAEMELKEKLENLLSEYSKEVDYDEYAVMRLKREVERAAIKLEYILSNVNEDLRYRYADRVYIANIVNRISKLIHTKKGTKALVGLMYDYAQLNRLLCASRELIFELSEEQRELMKIINKKYQREKEE